MTTYTSILTKLRMDEQPDAIRRKRSNRPSDAIVCTCNIGDITLKRKMSKSTNSISVIQAPAFTKETIDQKPQLIGYWTGERETVISKFRELVAEIKLAQKEKSNGN